MIFRAITAYLVLFLFLVSCQSNKALVAPSDDGTHYKRINLVVSDIDRSLTIYRDILGFTLHKLSESTKESFSYPVFNIPKDADLRFCTLDSPDQVRTMALTEVKGIDLPNLSMVPHMTASVIRVKNLPVVIKKIEALGLTTSPSKTAEGSDGGLFLEQAFVDFDGHLIVLYEFQK